MMIQNIFRKLTDLFRKDSVSCNNVILPAAHLRFCGKNFKDDHNFFRSAEKEAERLAKICELNASSHVLDVGCGPGRLAIGILNYLGEVASYSGFDVDQRSIKWCERHIASNHPNFQFTHIDISNQRYNPEGRNINEAFKFAVGDQAFDIIYLYSVFSHMTEKDVRAYLKEFKRVLKPKGKLFVTGFFEVDVPSMSENPVHYRMDWSGPLHCVRYNKAYFESLLVENDFGIDRFDYETETDGQSAIYASKRRNS